MQGSTVISIKEYQVVHLVIFNRPMLIAQTPSECVASVAQRFLLFVACKEYLGVHVWRAAGAQAHSRHNFGRRESISNFTQWRQKT